MSDKKLKSEKQSQSVRIHLEVLEKLMVLGDVFDTSSYNDTIDVVIQRAFPNIDELVELSRKKEKERKSALRDKVDTDEA